MVEIRIAVGDTTLVPGLMRRLADFFDRSTLSFDRPRKEIRVTSEWESRSVVRVVDAVASWLEENDAGSATVWVGKRSYTMDESFARSGR